MESECSAYFFKMFKENIVNREPINSRGAGRARVPKSHFASSSGVLKKHSKTNPEGSFFFKP